MEPGTQSRARVTALGLHCVLASLAVACASGPQRAEPGGVTVITTRAPAAVAAPAAAHAASVAAATPPTPLEACPRALTLDATAVADEAACLLARYVRLDTTNPPGNELLTARFLRDVLARDGIESQIIESAPGRANLIARLRSAGSGGHAVVLLHHMDVVPASANEWSVPPFAATVRDGQLWGRGSLDDKGGGVAELMVMLLAKRLATPLTREHGSPGRIGGHAEQIPG